MPLSRKQRRCVETLRSSIRVSADAAGVDISRGMPLHFYDDSIDVSAAQLDGLAARYAIGVKIIAR